MESNGAATGCQTHPSVPLGDRVLLRGSLHTVVIGVTALLDVVKTTHGGRPGPVGQKDVSVRVQYAVTNIHSPRPM